MTAAPTIHRAFRFRLYPTPEQEAALRQWSGVCRLVFNLAFEQRRDFYRQFRRVTGCTISFFTQSAELTQLRAEFDWIAAVPSAAESYALRDLDRAFASFFSGRGRYPNPRRRDQGHGVRLKGADCPVQKLSARWGAVRLPKLGWVRYRLTRPILGTVRNLTVNCTAGRWHVSFAADREHVAPAALPAEVGIDMGVAHTVTLSTGEHFDAPSLESLSRRLKRAQQTLARRKKGSGRYAAQRARVASISARAARVRTSWSHATTTALSRRFGLVAAEDLNIKGMTASAAGTAEQPGSRVAQKRGLNRSILAQGWGQITTQLAYKLEERGGALVFVDPKFTSQTCSACEAVDAKSRESQAVFQCLHCGHHDHADANAAKVILRRSTVRLDAEGAVARPMKRQPQEIAYA